MCKQRLERADGWIDRHHALWHGESGWKAVSEGGTKAATHRLAEAARFLRDQQHARVWIERASNCARLRPMKTAVFITNRYDRESLTAANAGARALHFLATTMANTLQPDATGCCENQVTAK